MNRLTRRWSEIDLLLLAFPMHFTWEFLQAPLFSSLETATHLEGIRACLQATLGDMGIVLAAFWVAALGYGRSWAASSNRRAVAIYLGVGLALTIGLEYLNTEVLMRWSYGAYMPRLPFFGTGLAPLAQWIIVPLIVLWYLRRLSGGVR